MGMVIAKVKVAQGEDLRAFTTTRPITVRRIVMMASTARCARRPAAIEQATGQQHAGATTAQVALSGSPRYSAVGPSARAPRAATRIQQAMLKIRFILFDLLGCGI